MQQKFSKFSGGQSLASYKNSFILLYSSSASSYMLPERSPAKEIVFDIIQIKIIKLMNLIKFLRILDSPFRS